jgi:hypothetical protein
MIARLLIASAAIGITALFSFALGYMISEDRATAKKRAADAADRARADELFSAVMKEAAALDAAERAAGVVPGESSAVLSDGWTIKRISWKGAGLNSYGGSA